MPKKIQNIIFIIFILINTYTFAQTKIWNNWYFGDKAGLSFNTESPTVLTDGQLSTVEGCATISDNDGNLLFYTNGVTVWDRNHNIMPNGTGLMSHTSSAQSSLILPKPNSNHIYYIFTTDAHENNDHCLRYSVVDMNLNNGMGDIITNQKNILIHNQSSEGLSASIHSNGTDYWIISHSYNSNRFYCNLFSETGINTESVISDIATPYTVGDYAKIKVSSSGKIAIANSYMIGLFNFDNATGKISMDNYYNFISPEYPEAVEFSQDNTKLYFSIIILIPSPFQVKMKLYQIDLSENNFAPVEIVFIENYSADAMQIASNGKIYLACTKKNGGDAQSMLSFIRTHNLYKRMLNQRLLSGYRVF